MQSIKLIVILYQRELYFREATTSRMLAKIKFSLKFPDLQYVANTKLINCTVICLFAQYCCMSVLRFYVPVNKFFSHVGM